MAAVVNILVCTYSLNTRLRLKLTLAYASIARTSWAIVSIRVLLSLAYIIVYGLGLFGLWRICGVQFNESLSPRSISRESGLVVVLVLIVLLSLRGVPPTIGF